MRRVAIVPRQDTEIRRVILHATEDGMYLYLSRDLDDRGSFADEWYESLAEAEAACTIRFHIERATWRDVPDPEPGCQHDWIAPVRVRGRAVGRPEWGVLERRVDGAWVPLDHLRR